MNGKNYIYLIMAFVVAMGCGFIITDKIKNNENDDTKNNEKEVTIPTEHVEEDDTIRLKPEPLEESNLLKENVNDSIVDVSIKVSTPPVLNGNTYSFAATVTGVKPSQKYHFELWSTTCIQKNLDGRFKNIPGIANGKYKVCVVDDATNENLTEPLEVSGFNLIEKPQPKEGISAEEFQKRMLKATDHTLDGGKGSYVSRNMKIVVIDMKEGEQYPTDIQAIREKIDFGIWKSAEVVGELSYDSEGLVTKVTIKPVY